MSRAHMFFPLLILAAAACDTTPLAPPDGPEFLIGQSPLAPVFQPVLDPTTGIMLGGNVALTVEVTKGLTEVRDADRFALRTGVRFTSLIDPKGDPVALVDPKNDPVAGIDPKDNGLRQGSMVPFDIEVPLPPDVWLTLLTQPGAVTAEADVSLVLATGAGDKILDGVTTAGGVDPKDSGVLAPETVALETEDLGNGTIVHRLVIGVFAPTLLFDPASGEFGFRSSAAFSLNGEAVALADPRPSPVVGVDPKDGGVALVVIALPLDDATWAAVDGATAKPGEFEDVTVEMQLVYAAADGREVVIDGASAAGAIDPKDTGVAEPSENDPDAGK